MRQSSSAQPSLWQTLTNPFTRGRFRWVPLLVVESSNQHRQLGSKISRLFNSKAVAQCEKHGAEDAIGLLSVTMP